MGCIKISMLVTMLMMVMLISCTTTVSDAQSTTPSCASNLVPCAAYLNTTHPPANCCTPLREAVEQQLDCLCNLYNTPGLLQSLGINITQALQLPKNCGLAGDLSACIHEAPSPSSVPPPVPGNDGRRIAWTGFSGLLLLGTSMMLY